MADYIPRVVDVEVDTALATLSTKPRAVHFQGRVRRQDERPICDSMLDVGVAACRHVAALRNRDGWRTSAERWWEGMRVAKYDSLRASLEHAGARGQTSLEMTFDEVGQLVGGLPKSATQLRRWWANDSKVEARAWRDAGWHVAWVSLEHRRVRFEVGVLGGGSAARSE